MKRYDSDQIVRLTDERKTVDLCSQEHDGARCTLLRGHDGKHASVMWRDGKEVSWED